MAGMGVGKREVLSARAGVAAATVSGGRKEGIGCANFLLTQIII